MLIIFDLDDTLIETSMGITTILVKKLCKGIEDLGGKLEPSLIEERFWNHYATGSSSVDAALEVVSWALPKSTAEKWDTLLNNFRNPDITHIEVVQTPGASELLSNLKDDYGLALCSRGHPELQQLKLKKAGIEPILFGTIRFGFEDKGVSYSDAMRSFGVDPSETIVCGDRVSYDLLPAKKQGCITVQFLRPFRNREEEYASSVDHRIEELPALLPLAHNIRSACAHKKNVR